jgi:Zn-dependent peptidase ImmA (M78 family)/DNA-binding XRE family transcriptional regulator
MEKLNPRMIALARESRGLKQEELGLKIGLSKQQVYYIEQSEQHLNPQAIKKLSEALNYEPCFFYQAGESLPLPLSYRKRNEVKAGVIKKIDAIVNINRIYIEKLISALNYEPREIPVLDVAMYGSPQKCAQELRKLWKIKSGPIKNLSEVLEQHGVFLLSHDFETDMVDGKCIIVEDKFPMIVTNKILLGDRQRFTLAYHLGYLVMHWRTMREFDIDKLRHESNLFAAEFLMPESDVSKDLQELVFGVLPKLKTKWKSSMVSLIYRSEDIGLTTENQKRYLMEQYNARGLKKREPKEFDIPVEEYELVPALVKKLKDKEKLNTKQLAEFFCMEQKEFQQRYNYN